MKTLLARGSDVAPAVLDRARDGDQTAFAMLIRHYDPTLRSVAYRLLGDRDRTEDALQETYMKAFRALPSFRGDSKLGTWLYRITYNVCLDELERSSRTTYVPLTEVPEPAETGPSVDEELAKRFALSAGLDALPPDDRAALLLVDRDGFDYRDAGEALGIPTGTVASRLNRARASMRLMLTPPAEAAA